MTDKNQPTTEEMNDLLIAICSDTFQAFIDSSKKHTADLVTSGKINAKTFGVLFTAILNSHVQTSIDWQIRSLNTIFNAQIKEKPFMDYFLSIVEKDWLSLLAKKKKH